MMQEKPGTAREPLPEFRIRLTTAFLLCLLLLLPALAGRSIVRERREAEAETRIAARSDDLRQMVAHIVALSEPKTFFERLVGDVLNRLRWGEDPTPALERIPEGTIRLFLFSGNGKRERKHGFAEESKVVSERVLGMIRSCAADPGRAFDERESRLLEGFLGRATSAKTMADNPGRLVECSMDQYSRLAGIFPFRTHRKQVGFLLALVDPGRVRLADLGRKALAKVRRLAGDPYSFGFLDLFGREPDHAIGPARLTANQRRLLLEPHATGTLRSSDGLLYAALLERRFRVYALAPLPALPEVLSLERIVPFLAGGVFLLVMTGFFPGSRNLFLPIRMQLVVLFGLAGLAGVLTLLGFANEYRESREAEAIREEFIRSREVLDRLEDRYGDFLQRQGALFRSFLRDCRSLADLPAVVTRLKRLERFRQDIAVFLVTASGTPVLVREPSGPYVLNQLWGRTAGRTAIRIIQRTLREFDRVRFASKEALTPAERANLDSQVDREFAKLNLRGLGRPNRSRYGSGDLTSFMEIAVHPTGHGLAGLYVIFGNGILERTFLRMEARRLRASFRHVSRRFLVLPKGRARTGTRGLFPSLREAEDLRRLNEVLTQAGTVEYRVGTWRRQPSILTGVPGRRLEDFNLYLVSSLTPITADIIRLQSGFLALSALILLFMGGLGWFFSRLLLEPLHLIEGGVRNLGRSRAESPVRVSTGDILEEIAKGVNAVAEEQEELARGLRIHEHLFPTEALSVTGVVCHGWHRSPARFGGEIYDHHPLPGNGLAFWIAGIPEFKLSSALLLAMSKMAVRLLLEHESSDPGRALAAWRERFLPTSGLADPGAARLALGVYQPQTGICTLAAFGDVAVFHARERSASTFSASGAVLPANTWTRVPPAKESGTRQVFLSPGDRLLIASPGVCPASTDGDRPAGPSSFQAMLDRIDPHDPVSFGPACFTALDRLHGNTGPQALREDQTLVLLQAGKGAES